MLKKLKLSLIPFACATTFFSIFSQVSCSINDSANSHYQYILDRTFSIVMYAEKYAVDKNAKIYQKSEYNSIPISAGTC
ncbi:hypothetical protein FACS189459_0110 [Bacilli bacterium]|nr:hypothetical protein FACS189459_0110 [Bacilli bacterium]